MNKTYTFTIDSSSVDEMTEDQYNKLQSDANDSFESPEEYGDYVYILKVKKDGKNIWLGLK